MFYVANIKCKKCIKRNNKFCNISKTNITKFINSKKFNLIIKSYLKCLNKYCLIKYFFIIKQFKLIKKKINIKNKLFKFFFDINEE